MLFPFSSPARGGDASPEKPALKVTVDPRVELMSIIFRLAGNPEYNQGRVASYVKAVEKHFGPHREHKVVQMARMLRRTRGVSYDACMSMAIHLSDPYTLEEKIPFEPRPTTLDSRWRPPWVNRDFLKKARHFVEAASFRKFITEQAPLYELASARMREVLKKKAHLEWFEAFFGERPKARFTVIVAPLNGGCCYGPRIRLPDGEESLYCVMGVGFTDGEGNPWFPEKIIGTVVHEFCHSFCNPLVEKHLGALEKAGKMIFPHVADAMKRQAYGNWKTMMIESLVRACVVRYLVRHEGRENAAQRIIYEKQVSFFWVEGLSRLLGEYEAQREKYPTLEAFFPRIVAFFDDYAPRFHEAKKSLVEKRPKVLSATPADGAEEVRPGDTEIRVVFDRPMRDGSWSLVGGGPHFPELTGKPSYDATFTIWTVAVRLKPEWEYTFMLNSNRFQGFRSREGVPLEPVKIIFSTGKGK
jgi:hypothetical protein